MKPREDETRLRGKTHFVSNFNPIADPRPFGAEISLSLFQNLWFSSCIPPRREGRFAIVTTRGVGCGGRGSSQR
jgi:hypothetical protein